MGRHCVLGLFRDLVGILFTWRLAEEAMSVEKNFVEFFLNISGVRPGVRGPFVAAKEPNTTLVLSWPFGSLPRFANSRGGVIPRRSRVHVNSIVLYLGQLMEDLIGGEGVGS